MSTWNAYWSVLDRRARILAIGGALALGGNGLLEGSALLALIPVLEGGAGLAASHVSRAWSAAAAWLGLPPTMLLPAALAMFATLGILAALLRFVGDRLMLKVRLAAERRARADMAAVLLRMDWSSYLTLRHGDIQKAIMVEGAQIASGTLSLFQGIGAAVTASFYLVTALYMSLEMTLYTIAFGAVIGIAYLWATKHVRKHFGHMSSMMAALADQVTTVFGHLKFFRASGHAGVAGARTDDLFGDYARASFRGQIYTPLLRTFFEGGAILFIALFLLWRVYWVQDSAAVTLIFLAVFYRLAPRLMSAQEGIFQARSYMPWFDSWRRRMDFARSHPGPQPGTRPPTFDKALALEDIRFNYPGVKALVLDGIACALRPGECLAVVGASGGGKTTLIDLLSGLLVPQSGRVTIDGTDLRDVDIESWRARLGIVMQDSPVFHLSVLDNVAWGDPQPDRAKAVACLRQAHALEFVDNLPQGIDTVVGEKGARLSGGQRQRIAIARALYRDPWLLILDEATSALDGESEDAVQAALMEQKGRFAIVMVAHRLKTVRMADRILVLNQGRIAEAGTWDELARRRGLFWEMLGRQGMQVNSTSDH
jgi:ABC-type multidrug transport system fused ATPase/permease subunit